MLVQIVFALYSTGVNNLYDLRKALRNIIYLFSYSDQWRNQDPKNEWVQLYKYK